MRRCGGACCKPQPRGRSASAVASWTGRRDRPRLAPSPCHAAGEAQHMASIALVSIVSRDRVGLVSAIADHLFAAGINLRDTTFAVLGQGAEFTPSCEL